MIIERYLRAGVFIFLIAFATFSFIFRISSHSPFQRNWHGLKREGDHLLMNVIHKSDYQLLTWHGELLWQGGDGGSGETMGCVMNISRKNPKDNSEQFIVALAGMCPQELAFGGYMVDEKFAEWILMSLMSIGLLAVVLFFAARWYVTSHDWNIGVIVVLCSIFLGGVIAHVFPWAVVFHSPVQVRMLFPG